MDRDMRLRKVCLQCNTVVHVKRSCCGCGHVFTLKRTLNNSYHIGEPRMIPKLLLPCVLDTTLRILFSWLGILHLTIVITLGNLE